MGFAIDIYGDVDVDGTNQPWDYIDGWVHRKNGKRYQQLSIIMIGKIVVLMLLMIIIPIN